jgi:hypothetical protein
MIKKSLFQTLIIFFSSFSVLGQPVGNTSYERPTFRRNITGEPDGVGGLAPQHLHWKDYPEYYTKDKVRKGIDELEQKGIIPLIGMQGWGDIYNNICAVLDEDSILNSYTDFNNPAFLAWAHFRREDPQYLDRTIDGEMPGYTWKGKFYSWGFISPAMPLDEKDIPVNSDIRTYGDWMAEQYGELCGYLGGLRSVALSDFYDCHPHKPIDEHDFNQRVVDDFIRQSDLEIQGKTLKEKGHYILDNYRHEWIDYWCYAYARFWGRMAESIQRHNPKGLPALILLQGEQPIATRRIAAVDHRIIAKVMDPNHILVGWDTQRMCGHRQNYAPESCVPSVLGIAAAREPLIRHYPNMECEIEDFWDGIAFNWSGLTPENQKEIGKKRLKRLWLETAWSHIADRDGKTRRTVCLFERYYWDGGYIDQEIIDMYLDICPKKPFGPAFYYSMEIERNLEQEKWRGAYLLDLNQPITTLREAGLAANYYVTDVALDKIDENSKPFYWIIPNQIFLPGDPLSKEERARLEKIAPVVTGDESVNNPLNPLKFTGGNRGIAGYGFYDQHDRLIVVASDRIVRGETNNVLPATTVKVEINLPDGVYNVKELFGGEFFSFKVKKGKGVFKQPIDRWDTKVFAITKE